MANRSILTNMVMSIIPSDNGMYENDPLDDWPLREARTNHRNPPVKLIRIKRRSEDIADKTKKAVAKYTYGLVVAISAMTLNREGLEPWEDASETMIVLRNEKLMEVGLLPEEGVERSM